MAGVVQQALKRNQAFAKSEPQSETEARLVGAAQDPVVGPMDCVRPEGGFPVVEVDVGCPQGSFGTLQGADGVNGVQRCPQFSFVDASMGRPALGPGLSFDYAGFDGFEAVTAGKRPPCARPMGFQDDVGVYEHRSVMARHGGLQRVGGIEAMALEKIGNVVEREIEQSGQTADGEMALLDREGENFEERPRKQGRCRAGGDSPAVMTQCFLRQGTCGGRLQLAEVDEAPTQCGGRHMKGVGHGIQPGDEFGAGELGPGAGRLQRGSRHEQCGGETVGKLLDAIAAGFARLFGMVGGHRVPCEDVEQLVGEIEMTTSFDLVTCDQHGIEFGKPAGSAGDAVMGVHREDEDAEFAFHDVDQAGCGCVAKTELGGEALAGQHGVLEARVSGEAERSSHKRGLASELCCQGTVRGDPTAAERS